MIILLIASIKGGNTKIENSLSCPFTSPILRTSLGDCRGFSDCGDTGRKGLGGGGSLGHT